MASRNVKPTKSASQVSGVPAKLGGDVWDPVVEGCNKPNIVLSLHEVKSCSSNSRNKSAIGLKGLRFRDSRLTALGLRTLAGQS